jgi:hypothetical protein
LWVKGWSRGWDGGNGGCWWRRKGRSTGDYGRRLRVGGSGGHAPWKGGPWSLEVALPWRVAAERDAGVESEKRERSSTVKG